MRLAAKVEWCWADAAPGVATPPTARADTALKRYLHYNRDYATVIVLRARRAKLLTYSRSLPLCMYIKA
jgi:hypothetical protein